MCVREMRKIVIDETNTVLISRGDPHVTDVDRQLAELIGPRAVVEIRPADKHDIAIARTSFAVLQSRAGIKKMKFENIFDTDPDAIWC